MSLQQSSNESGYRPYTPDLPKYPKYLNDEGLPSDDQDRTAWTDISHDRFEHQSLASRVQRSREP